MSNVSFIGLKIQVCLLMEAPGENSLPFQFLQAVLIPCPGVPSTYFNPSSKDLYV